MWGLSHFDTIEIAKKNEVIVEMDTWLGKENIAGYVKEDVYKTIKKQKKKSKVTAEYEGPSKHQLSKIKNWYFKNFL